MEVSCVNCNHTTKIDVNFDVKIYACVNCVYVYKNQDGLQVKDQFRPYTFYEKLEVGQEGVFNDKSYTITGILVKENQGFEWTEYILQGKEDYLYLSEADGHWIVLEEITLEIVVGHHPETVEYDETTFDCYDYCYPKLLSARGFFDFDIFEKSELIEYINPPLLLSFERVGKQQTVFLGKHISKRAIKKAFQTSILPTKRGVGLIQPFLFNLRDLAIVLCSVALLILISNWYLNKERIKTDVLDTQIPFDHYGTKDFVSPSFVLRGSAAPLSISLYSPVDNSWASVQVALVNEDNGEEIYANKDIEYYHGYTDGENWSEGSNSENFNLCGVAAGKYHLTLRPSKAVEDRASSFVQVKAIWSAPSSRNVWLISLIMIGFLIVVYYFEKNFEIKRWSDSSYSPYNNQ
ncbi:MAG TPA: DUF4178 domain-containing protein [Flavobacterium sp.]|nr:DUF4178 domain-containing protein [Flavobacterium sp.]